MPESATEGGGGVPLVGRLPRTHGLPPRWGRLVVALWAFACSLLVGEFDRGIFEWIAWFGFVPLTAVIVGAWLAASARSGVLTRRISRASAAPWNAPRLWNPAGTTAVAPIDPAGVARDPLATRLVACVIALLCMRLAPTFTWRCAIVIALLVVLAHLRPRNSVGLAVEYVRFPYRTGERATFRVRIAMRTPDDAFDPPVFTLRCVSETVRWEGLLWPEARCLASFDGIARREEGARVPTWLVEFDVPTAAPGTDLLARPSVCWELSIRGRSPGRSYVAEVLVPVYAGAAPVSP